MNNVVKHIFSKDGLYWMAYYFLGLFKGCKLFPAATYLKLGYYCTNDGRDKLDLKTPHTFNDKLNWLKLNDNRDVYSLMADKYEVKSLVISKIGGVYGAMLRRMELI